MQCCSGPAQAALVTVACFFLATSLRLEAASTLSQTQHFLCLWCTANTLVEKQEEQASRSSRYDLQTFEATSTDKPKHSSSTARPMITLRQAVTKGVKIGNTWAQEVYDSEAEPGHMTSRTFPSTNAQSQNEKCFGAAIGSQTWTRRVVQLQFKRTQNTPWPLS